MEKNKCHYGSFAFPLPFFKLVLFWPLINANISDQLPKCHKTACKAYRYVFSQKRSAGMLSRRPRKWQYAIPVHIVPLRAPALTDHQADQDLEVCGNVNFGKVRQITPTQLAFIPTTNVYLHLLSQKNNSTYRITANNLDGKTIKHWLLPPHYKKNQGVRSDESNNSY